MDNYTIFEILLRMYSLSSSSQYSFIIANVKKQNKTKQNKQANINKNKAKQNKKVLLAAVGFLSTFRKD